jgi:dihydroorotate dehydrogenase/Pyruvate/2-oxoacid:ferredoxin oxidoreductase delta subunit
MADLSIDFCGLRLRNPLIAASGPITGNAELVRTLQDQGIGAIVAKTSLVKEEYERWIGRKDVFPYKPVYKYQGLSEGRLYSLPSLAAMPAESMAREIGEMKKTGATVIGSAGAISRRGYAECARILEDAGADAIELNFCCTIPAPFRLFGVKANFEPEAFASILRDVKRRVSVPVGFKATQSLYLYEKTFEGMIRAKLKGAYPDFASLCAQLDINPGVDLETLLPIVPHFPVLGWQGDLAGLAYSMVAAYATSFGTENPPISVSGGMVSAKEAITAMALGARTVQIHTAILDKGPGVIRTMLADMEAFLDEKKISRIADIVGVSSRDYISAIDLGSFMRDRDGLMGRMRARVDAARCTGCGLCARICTEGGISMEAGRPAIDASRCRACNLCVLKCPRQALSLEGMEALDKLIAASKGTRGASGFRDFMAKERVGPADMLTLPKKLKEWHMA